MNTLLNRVQNWPTLAAQANWSVTKLAKLCSVSPRTLERYFAKTFGKSPKHWLADQRQKQAIKLLNDGMSVKEAAGHLGYKQAGNFSRTFTKYWGSCPTNQKFEA